ncbi:SnoaL-like domain-containing protein [Cupriavidus sp. H18C1]
MAKPRCGGYFDSSRVPFPDLTNEIIAIAADGDTVLVEFWLQGTHLGPLKANGKTYEPTGRTFRIRIAATFEFAPGSDKIICERPYSAPDAKLRALGLL